MFDIEIAINKMIIYLVQNFIINCIYYWKSSTWNYHNGLMRIYLCTTNALFLSTLFFFCLRFVYKMTL